MIVRLRGLEYDKISDRLRKEIRMLEKSRQLLQDLKRDGDALGLSRYPNIKGKNFVLHNLVIFK